MVSQVLMVLCLLVHLLSNIKPLQLALGLEDLRDIKTDVLVVLSIPAAAILSFVFRDYIVPRHEQRRNQSV